MTNKKSNLRGALKDQLDNSLQLAIVDGVTLGVRVQSFTESDWSQATIRLLRPFSWDAKERAFELVDVDLKEAKPVILVCGPYAAADAAALNVDPEHDVGFPESKEFDGVIYRLAGQPATAQDRYQDAAGWFTVAGKAEGGEEKYVSVALTKSNTQLIILEKVSGELKISLVLPKQVYPIKACQELIDKPSFIIQTGFGSHLRGQEMLRKIIVDAMPQRARNYPAPLIVDTWGFGTNVNQELVAQVGETAKSLNLEILTIDKGWEKQVGDWDTGDHFPEGLSGLSKIASDNEVRLGLWISLGNASPISEVAQAHPDWLATWRGKKQVVSHRTHSLCMGHAPVIEHLIGQVSNLAKNGMTWLLHDFETISRCDAGHHDHPEGLGEDWGVRGWYRLLSEIRKRHPQVWIENCWNGGRPLDLQMVAHHDTTIGDDFCDVRHNAVAKVGLGQFLPAHWCSSYMSDQNALPLRSQLAIYAVGGPWILMGDIPAWSEEKRSLALGVMETYRKWRPLFPEGSVKWASISGWKPDDRWRADQEVLAISFTHPNGSELMACVVTEGTASGEIIWHPHHQGAMEVRDEFSGEKWHLTHEEIQHGIRISAEHPDGHLLSVRPATIS